MKGHLHTISAVKNKQELYSIHTAIIIHYSFY